jgi:hypothetical protein
LANDKTIEIDVPCALTGKFFYKAFLNVVNNSGSKWTIRQDGTSLASGTRKLPDSSWVYRFTIECVQYAPPPQSGDADKLFKPVCDPPKGTVPNSGKSDIVAGSRTIYQSGAGEWGGQYEVVFGLAAAQEQAVAVNGKKELIAFSNAPVGVYNSKVTWTIQ